MAVKSSGPLSLGATATGVNIAAEYGDSAPYSMSEFKRAGGLVPDGPPTNNNIPTTNSNIKFSQFYSSVKGFVFSPTISADTLNYNLRSAAVTAGWDQVVPLISTVTINTGIYVGSSSQSTYSFVVAGSFPTGTTLALINNGYIYGMGGTGGNGMCKHDASGDAVSPVNWSYWQFLPANGGPAFSTTMPINVTNNGVIGGGGSGGSGGGASFYGSSPYGAGGGGGGQGYNVGYGNRGGGWPSWTGYGSNGSKTAAGGGGPQGAFDGYNPQADAGSSGSVIGVDGWSTAGNAVNGNSYITWLAGAPNASGGSISTSAGVKGRVYN